QGLGESAMSLDECSRVFEVFGTLIHVFQRAAPEGTLRFIPPGEGEKDREGDLAVSEVVADALAELGLPRRKIEHVVDQLEGDAKIAAKTIECCLLLARPLGNDRSDAARRREQLRGFGPD